MMNPRRINRLLKLHPVIDDIEDDLHDRVDDRRPTRVQGRTRASILSTIVGVIDDNGRLRAATALASP